MNRRGFLGLLACVGAVKAAWGVLCPEPEHEIEFGLTDSETGKFYGIKHSGPESDSIMYHIDHHGKLWSINSHGDIEAVPTTMRAWA